MACRKYSAWVTDASLGALEPSRGRELLAHTAECDACREAYQHAREVAAFVDHGVEALVSGKPSPHFDTRLRARIAAEPAPAHLRWQAWVPVAASGLALAGVLLVLLMRSPRPGNPNHVAEVIHENPSPAAGVSLLPQPVPVSPLHGADFVPAAHHKSVRKLKSEVLVQPGQFAAIMQYADALRTGRINGEQLISAQQPLDKPLEVAPLEIPALETPRSDTITPSPSENTGRR